MIDGLSQDIARSESKYNKMIKSLQPETERFKNLVIDNGSIARGTMICHRKSVLVSRHKFEAQSCSPQELVALTRAREKGRDLIEQGQVR